MEKKYITTNELAETLRVSRVTLGEWRKKGMPHMKSGKFVRYVESEVVEWLRNQKKA